MKLSAEQKKVFSFTASIIGTASAIFSFATTSLQSFNPFVAISILGLTIIIVLIIVYIIPKDNLPDGINDISDELDNINSKGKMKIVFPCDAGYYRAANKLAKEKFGKNSVNSKTVDDWKKRNELILSCLSDSNKMVGYFDILPLKTAFAQELIQGNVGEKDIKAEHILGVHEMKDAEYIYFAGIAVQDTGSGKGCIHGNYLISAAILYIKLFYNNSQLKKVLTIPTSDCGLKIAEHLNFSLEREGNLRQDGFAIYSFNYSSKNILKVIQKKQGVYRRFDVKAYLKSIKKITGQEVDQSFIIN